LSPLRLPTIPSPLLTPHLSFSLPLSTRLVKKMNRKSFVVAAVVGLGPLLLGLQLTVLRRIGDPETKKSFGNFIHVQMLVVASSFLMLIHYHLYRKIISHTVCVFFFSFSLSLSLSLSPSLPLSLSLSLFFSF
jgi:hypothetical protein